MSSIVMEVSVYRGVYRETPVLIPRRLLNTNLLVIGSSGATRSHSTRISSQCFGAVVG